MYKEIFKILVKESKYDRLLDKNTLNKILDILINNYSIERDIKLNIESDLNSNEMGSYNNNTCEISLNIDKIVYFNNYNQAYFTNIEILESFLHEFMHAKQYDSLNKNNYLNIKDLLLKIEHLLALLSDSIFSDLYIIENFGDPADKDVQELVRLFYQNHHDLVPLERMAEIDALKFTRTMISNYDKLDIRREGIVDALSKDLYSLYLYGYEYDYNNRLISPTENYFEVFNYNIYNSLIAQHLETIVDIEPDRLTDSTLLRLGLPIDNELYYNVKTKYNYLDNKLKLNKNR